MIGYLYIILAKNDVYLLAFIKNTILRQSLKLKRDKIYWSCSQNRWDKYDTLLEAK